MYFDKCASLDQLKAEYRRLCLIYHPDTGSDKADTAIMAAINAEHDKVFNRLKAEHNARAAADTTGRTKATTETPAEFRDIVTMLLRLDGLKVELCGSWLWIGGDTMKHKDALKAAGCAWAPKKRLWSWHHAEDGSKRFRGNKSMSHIRMKYGSKVFAAGDDLPAVG